MRRVLFPLVLIIAFAGLAASAQQPIPEERLEANLKQCLAGCRQNNEEDVCQTLCGCTIDQFRTKLSLADYLTLETEMKDGEMSPPVQKFLDETAAFCAAQVPQ